MAEHLDQFSNSYSTSVERNLHNQIPLIKVEVHRNIEQETNQLRHDLTHNLPTGIPPGSEYEIKSTLEKNINEITNFKINNFDRQMQDLTTQLTQPIFDKLAHLEQIILEKEAEIQQSTQTLESDIVNAENTAAILDNEINTPRQSEVRQSIQEMSSQTSSLAPSNVKLQVEYNIPIILNSNLRYNYIDVCVSNNDIYPATGLVIEFEETKVNLDESVSQGLSAGGEYKIS